jgi:hypothetical protein
MLRMLQQKIWTEGYTLLKSKAMKEEWGLLK